MKLFITDVVRSLTHSWARTIFAVTGIVMGIASLVFIVAAIEGSSSKANAVIKSLGPDSILIFSGSTPGAWRKRPKVISHEHVRMLSRLDGTFALAYGLGNRMNVKSGAQSMTVSVTGISPQWFESWDYKIDEGVEFGSREYESFNKKVVVGHDLAEYLYPEQNAIGKTLTVNNSTFTIIGMYERKGKSPNGNNLDQSAFMTLGVYQKLIEQEYKYLSVIRLRVTDVSNYDYIEAQVRQVLEQKLQADDFFILTPTQIKSFLSVISSGLAIFLGIASATALLISGFVLSNIFSINVEVRRWEIGLRRALGATKRDITIRFLAEALCVTMLGTLIGTALGFLGVWLAMPLLDIPSVYPVKAFIIAVIFSSAVGLLAAMSPAKKAANFEPLAALRAKI